MFSDYNLVTFNKPFLQKLKNLDDKNEIKNILIEYGNRNNYEEGEVIYFYIKNILSNGFFFEMKETVINEIFFEAAYWASTKETKQKIRPKNFNDIKDKKTQKFFTKLTQALIVAITKKYYVCSENEMDNVKYNLELSKYLEVMYEVSCVKRNRLTK